MKEILKGILTKAQRFYQAVFIILAACAMSIKIFVPNNWISDTMITQLFIFIGALIAIGDYHTRNKPIDSGGIDFTGPAKNEQFYKEGKKK